MGGRLTSAGANTVQALGALLDKIGPAVVMVHSQSGAYGLDLVRARAAKMLAFIHVEGNCAPVTADEIAKTFSKVPLLSVWGDNSQGAQGPNGDARRNGCVSTVDAIKAAGGGARFLLKSFLDGKFSSPRRARITFYEWALPPLLQRHLRSALRILRSVLFTLPARRGLPGIDLRRLTACPLSQERPSRLIGGALPTLLHRFSCLVTGVVGTRHVTHVSLWVVL